MRNWLAKQRAKGELLNVFKIADIGVRDKERFRAPKIHDIAFNYNDQTLRYVFTLPNGVDPKLVRKKEYVFHQVFGKNIRLTGDLKKYTLTIFAGELPKKVTYNYADILAVIERDNIIVPIVAGRSREGELCVYDATNAPNLLIFGEPGSGKSSTLHSITTTLIQLYSAEEMHFYMADFKMSELNVYEQVPHVKSISYLARDLAPALEHLKRELERRGELLKAHKVRHVNKLPAEVKRDCPYIMLIIDEFVMIRDKEIMAQLLQIASLGRAYGIYAILSMQRPSHSILSTDVRGMLSVRMGFRTVDLRNALMGETPGAEQISKDEPGKFILNRDELTELRAPYLDEEAVEKILAKYKTDDWRNHSYSAPAPHLENETLIYSVEREVFDDVID
ncbi:FtsK/SpoIIIE domain-containing protein [Sutcliffiella horikoshii]|uniref:FtsK/SpoIIIE domain-containing protein n=1 Tax=Sutcliffiella horikoshii TaxID=79883 RepID=UPI003CF04158